MIQCGNLYIIKGCMCFLRSFSTNSEYLHHLIVIAVAGCPKVSRRLVPRPILVGALEMLLAVWRDMTPCSDRVVCGVGVLDLVGG